MTRFSFPICVLFLTLVTTACVTGRKEQDLPKNRASYHYKMGLAYISELNYTQALIELTEAEKITPNDPDVLYNLAYAYMGRKRPDLAEPRLQKTIAIKPNNSMARNLLGVAYLELRQWDNAIQQFKIVRDDLFYSRSDDAAINLGLSYLGKGDHSMALTELNAVLIDNPQKIQARVVLGRVYSAMDKPEQSIIEYKKALGLYKNYSDAYYYLGLAHLKLQNIAEARAAFNEVIRVKPDSELGRLSMGYLDLLK